MKTYVAWIVYEDGSMILRDNLTMNLAQRKYRLFLKDRDMSRCGWSSMKDCEYLKKSKKISNLA